MTRPFRPFVMRIDNSEYFIGCAIFIFIRIRFRFCAAILLPSRTHVRTSVEYAAISISNPVSTGKEKQEWLDSPQWMTMWYDSHDSNSKHTIIFYDILIFSHFFNSLFHTFISSSFVNGNKHVYWCIHSSVNHSRREFEMFGRWYH